VTKRSAREERELHEYIASAVVMSPQRWKDPLWRPSYRAVLVGEANPLGGDPRAALFPKPIGSAGWRLCHKVLGLSPFEYCDQFHRVNLCPVGWCLADARVRAVEVAVEAYAHDWDPSASPVPLVLLGAKVAQAFRVPYEPFTVGSWLAPGGAFSVRYASLPHPSGLCRAWNVSGAYERARGLVLGLTKPSKT